ncbi:hypothetical protein ACFQL0_13765 [Haloplanus litoreus]|uniref:hypothetical protein n=1 Tax=Haloplanus litoreus TaxID=767515 RepID=UPI00360F417D
MDGQPRRALLGDDGEDEQRDARPVGVEGDHRPRRAAAVAVDEKAHERQREDDGRRRE